MDKKLLLNRNEVTQGPSPQCFEVLKNFPIEKTAFYFNGYFGSTLIPKLSKSFNVLEQQIIIGHGLEDIFRIIFDSLSPAKDVALCHDLHFTYYDKYLNFKNVSLENFRLIEKENEFSFDTEDCIEKIKTIKPKVVLITSPNNPTGHSIGAPDLVKVLEAADKATLIVLDEAYCGFDPEYVQSDFLALLEKHENLMILRSFSKLYALAGLRIGFALCGKKVKEILRYQNYYLGGSQILEDVAVAALESEGYYQNLSEEIISDRENFIVEVNKLRDFKAFNSKANFVLVRVRKEIKAAVEKELEGAEVVIAKFISEDLLRVSVGTKQHTVAFLEALKKIDL